ncbi:MAG TPA: aminotransferase class III-fold pyridoxal phosphate-dependent enzyme [Candidatus Limnocylindria bacterium]|nr:aminotransferase class III-fold pyridoxal phosphate-dependent enzyme [Candidatus Limnocylindria bacterium]
MTVRTERGADLAKIAQDTKDHVLISWSAQGAISPLVVTGGEGCWIHSGDRRILDLSSTLVNTNLGHQHPKVVAAIQEQAATLTYAAPGFTDAPRATLARMIAEVAPGDLVKTLFTTGGTEAVESAIKIARLYTGRHKVMTQWRSFHGQTQGSMTAGGDNRRWANEPGIPGIVRFLNPDPYRSIFGNDVQKALAHVEEVIWYEGPEHIAAIMCEPIVGASGLIVPPDGFFQGIRRLCDQYGIVMILDEVMTGFGRTGRWFAAEHWDVVPDLMTFAKGVNSGYVPLGGVVVDEPIAKHFQDQVLWQGLTYSGHALACAAGVATIRAYRDERVIENAARMGEIVARELGAMKERHPSVGDVRGKGLMWGIELVKDKRTKAMLERWNGPSQKLATALRTALMQRDVYLMTRWNLMVVAPPLVITEDELRTGLRAIDEVLGIADRYAATGEL